MSPRHAVGVSAVEIVGAEFVVRDAVAHQVVRDLEYLVTHGDDGFLMPAMAFDTKIAGLQGGVLFPRCGQRTPG